MRDIKALTVGELIEELKNYDKNLPVVYSYNYGDHWRTTVAEEAREIDDLEVEWSDYHNMFKVPRDDHDDYEQDRYGDEPKEGRVHVVRIS